MDGNVYMNGVEIVNKKGTELASTGGSGHHGSLYRGRTPDSGCCRCSFAEKILPIRKLKNSLHGRGEKLSPAVQR